MSRFMRRTETAIITDDVEFASKLVLELRAFGLEGVQKFSSIESVQLFFYSSSSRRSANRRVTFLDPLLASSQSFLIKMMEDEELSGERVILIGDAENRTALIEFFVLGATGHVMRDSDQKKLREKIKSFYD